MIRALVTLSIWYVAFAVGCAAADVAQVSSATGGRAMIALGVFALGLWAIVGLGAAIAAMLFKAVTRDRRTNALWTAGLIGFALLETAAYVNIVALPSLLHPVTMLANAAMLAAAAGLYKLIARRAFTETVANFRAAAVTFLCIGAAACLWFAAGTAPPPAPTPAHPAASDMPNVVVIVIDTLRLDRTGIDGSLSASRTPALDDLAKRGLAFTNAYAQASWTKPSVASLFTSLFPSTHGANFRRDRLPDSPVTLPEVFAAAGYRTAVFSANPWISPAFGFERGVDLFVETEPESFVRLLILPKLWKAPDRLLTGAPMSRVLSRLEDVFRVRGERRSNCARDAAMLRSFGDWFESAETTPSFAYLHLMSPHIPYDPPHAGHEFPNIQQVDLLQSDQPLDVERREQLLALYDATVSHADMILGAIVEIIDDGGALSDTIVVVTADHGEEFFEHGRWGHGKSLYDELVNVPLVIAGYHIPPVVRDDPAMLVDVLPTLVDVLSITPNAEWEGESLMRPDPQRGAYAELVREGGMTAYMLYRPGRKYLEITDKLGDPTRRLYFDLDKDPRELSPMPGDGTTDMREELERIRAHAEAKKLDSTATDIGRDAEEKLRALGYIN